MGDASSKFEPVLPLYTALYVLDGPMDADGYEWFRVVPLSFELRHPKGFAVTDGWVAAASREGVSWVAPSAVTCPPTPADVLGVRALSSGERLACFSRVPITFEARLAECDCDVDGPGVEPSWFASYQLVLAHPSESTNPVQLDTALFLALDPAADAPDPLPIDQVVHVTGMFDHPAAATCLVGGLDEPLQPSHDCRFTFAVTSIESL